MTRLRGVFKKGLPGVIVGLMLVATGQTSRAYDKVSVLAELDAAIEKNTDEKVLAALGKMRKVAALNEAKYVKSSLTINFVKMPVIPSQIGIITKLSHLELANNEHTSLPTEIGQLKNLTILTLNNNQLSELPPEIWNLENLGTLALAKNKFKAIPPEIGKLQKLIALTFHGNQLTELPPELWKLPKLNNLGLGQNKLTSIPSEIGKVLTLGSLDVSGNQITDSDLEHLKSLKALYFLNLRGTKVTEKGVKALKQSLPKCQILSDQ